MLSNLDILDEMKKGNITINPFEQNRLQPASYDILLGYEFLIFENHSTHIIDPKTDTSKFTRKVVLENPGQYLILHPKEFILGVSYEKIGVGPGFACELMGKSSLARLGLIVHTTAGFIDPGNSLKITLEMVNFNTIPLKLYPKMKIAQVSFSQLRTPTDIPYGTSGLGSKYYNAEGVQASSMHLNFSKES